MEPGNISIARYVEVEHDPNTAFARSLSLLPRIEYVEVLRQDGGPRVAVVGADGKIFGQVTEDGWKANNLSVPEEDRQVKMREFADMAVENELMTPDLYDQCVPALEKLPGAEGGAWKGNGGDIVAGRNFTHDVFEFPIECYDLKTPNLVQEYVRAHPAEIFGMVLTPALLLALFFGLKSGLVQVGLAHVFHKPDVRGGKNPSVAELAQKRNEAARKAQEKKALEQFVVKDDPQEKKAVAVEKVPANPKPAEAASDVTPISVSGKARERQYKRKQRGLLR